MGNQYGDFFEHGVSPLPLFLVVAALLYALWHRIGVLVLGYQSQQI